MALRGLISHIVIQTVSQDAPKCFKDAREKQGLRRVPASTHGDPAGFLGCSLSQGQGSQACRRLAWKGRPLTRWGCKGDHLPAPRLHLRPGPPLRSCPPGHTCFSADMSVLALVGPESSLPGTCARASSPTSVKGLSGQCGSLLRGAPCVRASDIHVGGPTLVRMACRPCPA